MNFIREKEEEKSWENEPLLTTFCSNYQDVEQEYRKYIPLKVGKRANKRKSLNTTSIVLMELLLGVSIASVMYVGYLSFKENMVYEKGKINQTIIDNESERAYEMYFKEIHQQQQQVLKNEPQSYNELDLDKVKHKLDNAKAREVDDMKKANDA